MMKRLNRSLCENDRRRYAALEARVAELEAEDELDQERLKKGAEGTRD